MLQMRIPRLLIVSFLLATTTYYTQAQSLQQSLQTAINHLQSDSQCSYASVSLTVLDAQTGEQVFAVNPNMGLAPASTLKTVTSITAFNLLGPDFQYQTHVGYSGSIDASGTLNGDVVIKGGGDPTLGSWRWIHTKEAFILNSMVTALQRAGIHKINGAIVGDDSQFGTQSIPDGWIWQDVGNYYGAGTSALTWRENTFDIKLHTGALGNLVSVVRTVPWMPYLNLKSEIMSGPAGTGDKSYAYLPVGGKVMYLRGSYAVDHGKNSITVAMPDPAYDIAFRLTDTLKRVGISVSAEPESTITLTAKALQVPVATHEVTTIFSPLLGDMIYWLNQKSINLYAEQFVKTMALKQGRPVTTHNGVEIIQNFWKVRGIDPGSLNIYDGSGLSPGDRITTLTMSKILQSAVKESWYSVFYDSLPIYNNMHMKSGTIADVVAYTGYQTHNGRKLCFSAIINNYNGSTTAIRQKLFRVLDELK
jgi:D-alanyl-D-alanine carboxypeptidase/D-alanyl-D-alanine-endopeptidase (penicillin-binding protein 4)